MEPKFAISKTAIPERRPAPQHEAIRSAEAVRRQAHPRRFVDAKLTGVAVDRRLSGFRLDLAKLLSASPRNAGDAPQRDLTLTRTLGLHGRNIGELAAESESRHNA